MEVFIADVESFGREAGKLQPAYQDFAAKMLGLVEAIRRDIAAAEAPGTPRAKVVALERAKWGLGQLVECGTGVPTFELTGVAETHARLQALEADFEARGYFRAAGISRK